MNESIDLLQRHFSLTPAEARLALHLVAGETLRCAAVKLSISYETARTCLKKIFNKTGTCRQAALVIVILTALPAALDPQRLGSKEQIFGVNRTNPRKGSERLSGIGPTMWEREECVSSDVSPTCGARRAD